MRIPQPKRHRNLYLDVTICSFVQLILGRIPLPVNFLISLPSSFSLSPNTQHTCCVSSSPPADKRTNFQQQGYWPFSPLKAVGTRGVCRPLEAPLTAPGCMLCPLYPQSCRREEHLGAPASYKCSMSHAGRILETDAACCRVFACCYSKCGLWTCSSCNTRKHLRNADSQVPHWNCRVRFLCTSKFEKYWFMEL